METMPESLERLSRETRHALRSLQRAPAFTAATIATLALGIGAVTLTFDLLHGTLIRPLPFPEPATLLLVQAVSRETTGREWTWRWSYPWYERLRDGSADIADIAAYGRGEVNLAGDGLPERIATEVVSPNYFRVLRVEPAQGRTFPPDGARAEVTGTVVLGHDLWRRRWAADGDVLGRTIRIDGVPLEVIAVMPPGFAGASGEAELWFTHQTATRVTFEGQLTTLERFLTLLARPLRGATSDALQAQLAALTTAIALEIPDEDARPGSTWTARVAPLEAARVRPERRRATLLLFGAVWFVLAIVCVNVAALQLLRAESRRREFAIRAAIGGGRGIARLVLLESAVLAVAGGGLGAIIARSGAAWLTGRVPRALPAASNDYGAVAEFVRTGSGTTVLLFALAVTGLTALACGIVPALRARTPAMDPLAARHDTQTGGRAALATFAGAQIALALVLITGAGLFLGALARNLDTATGARTEDILTFWVSPPAASVATRSTAGTDRLLDAVRAVPGIVSATVSRCAPLTPSCSRAPLWVDRQPDTDPPISGRHYVAEDHFRTLDIPLLRGRAFTMADDTAGTRVAILSASAARLFPPGVDPIGRTVRFAPPDDVTESDWHVVGIVADVLYWPPDGPPGVDVYTPYRQHSYPSVMVITRTAVPPAGLVPALRAAVATAAPDLPIHDVQTLEQRTRDAFAARAFQTVFLTAFGLIALLLATLGAWGLARASVARRTGEFGVRLALGAGPRDLLRMVLGENLRVSLTGIAIGAVLAFATARVLRTLLDEITAPRVLPLVLAAALLLAASTLATVRPAHRAGRTDPMRAIRTD